MTVYRGPVPAGPPAGPGQGPPPGPGQGPPPGPGQGPPPGPGQGPPPGPGQGPPPGPGQGPPPGPGTGTGGRGRKAGWRSTLFWGIISGIISGALVSFSITATGHSVEIFTASWFYQHPTCDNPGWLLQVPDTQIFSGSSQYEGDHSPDLTVDGNLRSAWLQWWPKYGLNNGTSRPANNLIYWSFPQQYDVRLVCIVDGWMQNSTTYKITLPIGSAALSTAIPNHPVGTPNEACKKPIKFNGSLSQLIHFKDFLSQGASYEWQQFNVDYETQGLALAICGVSQKSVNDREEGQPSLEKFANPENNAPSPLVGLSEIRFYYAPYICAWPGLLCTPV